MAPNSNIVLVRHSQAEHNVNLEYDIHDAPLTSLGKKQSASLPAKCPQLQEQIDLIVASPLKRTLQSTMLGWGPAVKRLGIENVICLPAAQECNAFPCDTGSTREVLKSIDEFKDFNYDLLDKDWTSKKGFYAADPVSLSNRAKYVRQFLRERPERTILLVAHGDILRRVTSDIDGPSNHPWGNAEVRIYKFDPKTVDTDDCWLYQEEKVAAVPGYPRTSTEFDLNGHL